MHDECAVVVNQRAIGIFRRLGIVHDVRQQTERYVDTHYANRLAVRTEQWQTECKNWRLTGYHVAQRIHPFRLARRHGFRKPPLLRIGRLGKHVVRFNVRVGVCHTGAVGTVHISHELLVSFIEVLLEGNSASCHVRIRLHQFLGIGEHHFGIVYVRHHAEVYVARGLFHAQHNVVDVVNHALQRLLGALQRFLFQGLAREIQHDNQRQRKEYRYRRDHQKTQPDGQSLTNSFRPFPHISPQIYKKVGK